MNNQAILAHDIELVLLDDTNANQAADCLTKVFTQLEPMTRSLGLSVEMYSRLAQKYCQLAAEDGLSFVAREIGTGAIAGFLISVDVASDPARLGEVDPEVIMLAAPSGAFLEQLEGRYLAQQQFAEGQCIHLFYAGVMPQFSRKGIATALTEKAIENAIGKGYSHAIMDCTSSKSKKIGDYFDFSEENYLAYKEFSWAGPNPFAELEGGCTFMVKQLIP